MSDAKQRLMVNETVLEEGWVFADRTNPYALSQSQKRQCVAGVTLFDRDWLTAQVIDSFTETDHQQDWIGLLQHDWQLELYNLNLLGMKDENGSLKHSCLSVKDLVFLIRQVRYQPLIILHRQHWGYTCCLQIAGLGRVRLVVCFNNPQCFGRYAAFVTNCLDWSPRHIVAHWMRSRPATHLYSRHPSYKFHLEDGLQSA